MRKNRLRPIHPGEILREEYLVPLGMSAHALRLARYFGTTAEFWVNLQAAFDLRSTAVESSAAIEREVLPRAA